MVFVSRFAFLPASHMMWNSTVIVSDVRRLPVSEINRSVMDSIQYGRMRNVVYNMAGDGVETNHVSVPSNHVHIAPTSLFSGRSFELSTD